MSKKIGLLFVVPLLFLFCLAGLSLRATSPMCVDFEQYSKAYKQMIGDDTLLNNYQEKTISYDNVLVVDEKNMIKISDLSSTVGENFELVKGVQSKNYALSIGEQKSIFYLQNSYGEKITVDKVLEIDGEKYVSLDEVAQSLNYELLFEENQIVVEKTFETKRLIVYANKKISTFGACDVVRNNDFSIFEYETEQKTAEAYKKLLEQKNVQSVEVDGIVKAEETVAGASGMNDSFSYTTWGAKAMNVDVYSAYLSNQSNLPTVYVAVLDTGIDTDHPWFKNRIASDLGANYVSSSVSFEDYYGHGTHVAGTIVDLTFSNVKIIPVKVLNDYGYGYRSCIVNGIYYINYLKTSSQYSNLNIVAINMSLGMDSSIGSSDYNAIKRQVDNLYSLNVLSIVAAGNEGVDVRGVCPANITNAITVAAVAQSGTTYSRPTWSNYGSYVDICAPGSEIESAYIGGITTTLSGTSMATPHITACVALLYSDLSKNYAMSDIEKILTTNVVDLGDVGKDAYFGYGLLDLMYANTQMLDVVQFSQDEGACYQAFDLTLSHSNPYAVIYYTLDGSAPSKDNGIQYTSPITIEISTTVKAIAYMYVNTDAEIFSKVNQKSYYFANTDTSSNYEVEDGVLTAYNGSLKQLIVPTSINGQIITKVGEAAFARTNIESVTFSNYVTKIDNNAFFGCTKLESVYAPKVEWVGDCVFYNCRKLKKLDDDYFQELKYVGKQSFYNCESLQTITLSKLETIDYQAFCMQDGLLPKLSSINLPAVKTISEEAFVLCINLTDVIMPNVETICSDAFYCCSIKTLSLPEVKNLGNYAFYNNSTLTKVSIPKAEIISSYCFYATNVSEVAANGVTFVGKYAFYNATNLQTVSLSSLREIGEYAFYGCSSLNNFHAENVQVVHNHAFDGCARLYLISLPKIISLQSYAFANCGLTQVTVSASLSEFGTDVFSGVKKSCKFFIYVQTPIYKYLVKNDFVFTDLSSKTPLVFEQQNNEISIVGYSKNTDEEIIVPAYINGKKVTKIAENAFAGCQKLTSVNSTFIVEVGANAFKNCKNLGYVNLENVKTIGEGAFSGCTKLQYLNIANATIIGQEAFFNCPKLLSVSLNKNISHIGIKAFAYLDPVDDVYQMVSTFVLFGYNDVAQNYVTHVNEQKVDEDISMASASSEKVNSTITYKESYYVLSVDDFSYGLNKMNKTATLQLAHNYLSNNIIIPGTITVDGEQYTIVAISTLAFDDCSFIENIVLPSTITDIPSGAFKNCSRLRTINLDNIKTIGSSAFEGCDSLKVADMPEVKSIGASAFKDCLSLETVSAPNLVFVYESSFSNCSNLKNVTVPEGISIPTVNNEEAAAEEESNQSPSASINLPNIVLIIIILASVIALAVCFVMIFKVFNRQA